MLRLGFKKKKFGKIPGNCNLEEFDYNYYNNYYNNFENIKLEDFVINLVVKKYKVYDNNFRIVMLIFRLNTYTTFTIS